ncbi:MAG: SIS domain-containing protein [Lachnospiraceae bacterium]|nr:SIS domain-containing protein [Lachnospiraceae bacterium]
MIRAVLFDIDGVITDGKQYIGSDNTIVKTIALKDLDAIKQLKEMNLILGYITGEENIFTDEVHKRFCVDYEKTGCKDKISAIEDFRNRYELNLDEICYIGDGKYDIPVIRKVGLGACPMDAIDEVKQVSNMILSRKGGEGCLAELYTRLNKTDKGNKAVSTPEISEKYVSELIRHRMEEHRQVLELVLNNMELQGKIEFAAQMMTDALANGNQVLFCGNGGSAADAQHLATELVSRFYMERQALNAETLTTNTSSITAIGNDYVYDRIFARQVEAKGKEGDILVGITTSGGSKNIQSAFVTAREKRMKTVLLTREIDEKYPIYDKADVILGVESMDTPRIQEMHIMIGHIICEIIEKKLAK